MYLSFSLVFLVLWLRGMQISSKCSESSRSSKIKLDRSHIWDRDRADPIFEVGRSLNLKYGGGSGSGDDGRAAAEVTVAALVTVEAGCKCVSVGVPWCVFLSHLKEVYYH